MREILLIVIFLPVGLLTTLKVGLGSLEVPKAPPSTPVVIATQLPFSAGGTLTPIALSTPIPSITSEPESERVQQLIGTAMTWLKVPYLWGGCSRKGVDCSCAVQNWLATIGIHAPRTTPDQVRWVILITRSQLRPGDLLFYNDTCTNCGVNPTHVAMYLGDGLMINAGDPVQIGPAFGPHFAVAGRPPGL